MIVTLTVPAHLVQRHEQNNIPGIGISIIDFIILPKTIYDCGDYDCIIFLHDSTIVETILPCCVEYKFIPNTTIRQFAKNKDLYPIGTIGAAITYCKMVGLQYIIHIKDGDLDDDKGTLPVLYFFIFFLAYFDILKCTQSYSRTIIMFFVTYSIVRHICTLIFFNGMTIAKRGISPYAFQKYNQKERCKRKGISCNTINIYNRLENIHSRRSEKANMLQDCCKYT